MSEEPKHSKRQSRTDDDAARSPSPSTDSKRGAFSKGRALSSKALGAKRISTTATPTTAEEKERVKRELLEAPEKKKSKHKESTVAGEESVSPTAESSSGRVKIKPLDDATSEAIKKKTKRRGSESAGDDGKASKPKRPSRDPTPEADSASSSRSKANLEDSPSEGEVAASTKKSKRGSVSGPKDIPPLAVAPPALPPILSDGTVPTEDLPAPITPTTKSPHAMGGVAVLPPPSPSGTSSPRLNPASPRPFGSPRVTSPSPRPVSVSPAKLPPALPNPSTVTAAAVPSATEQHDQDEHQGHEHHHDHDHDHDHAPPPPPEDELSDEMPPPPPPASPPSDATHPDYANLAAAAAAVASSSHQSLHHVHVDDLPPPPAEESLPAPLPTSTGALDLPPPIASSPHTQLQQQLPPQQDIPVSVIDSVLPSIINTGSTASLPSFDGSDTEEEHYSKESSKKEKRSKKHKATDSVSGSTEISSDSAENSSSSKHHHHTRERSGTKSRRDSVALSGSLSDIAPLALTGVQTSPPSTHSARSPGSMRLNRTPRGENVASPRGQIIIVTPRGEMHVTEAINVSTPSLPSLASSVADLTGSTMTHRDSIDSLDEATRAALSASAANIEDVPPPPPMPTIGVNGPPPPPPMPSRGDIVAAGRRATDADQPEEPVAKRSRTRRVVPEVDAAMSAWDNRVTNFESKLAADAAHRRAPEELLEFPHDDLIIEIVHSQLEHYPALDKDSPQSVLDAYASYTTQTKMIHHQSEWYGTKTSQKDRVKEHEMRNARLKAEAEKQAAAAPPVPDIKTTSIKKSGDATGRRQSLSRDTAAPAAITRRTSRAIKMTNSPSTDDMNSSFSALPELTDDDSSAQESGEGDSTTETAAAAGAPSPSPSGFSLATSTAAASNTDDEGLPEAPATSREGRDRKGPGSSKRAKNQSSDRSAGVTGGADLRVAMDPPARPSSPDGRNRPATLRPSKGSSPESGPSTPPKNGGMMERPRLSSRGLSGVAASSSDVGSGQATFSLNPKMMVVDEKIRKKENDKANLERRGIFEIFTPLSISSEASDHVQQVEPLRPKVDTRIMLHFKNIRFNLGYEEPFFISAAFYDIEKRIRLTETFYADFNDQNELLKSLLGQFYGPAEPESMAKRYVANLTYHGPSVYLILRVNTVLHGDIDDIADAYAAGSSTSSKDKQKLIDGARQATSLFGKFQQGFGWAALQVFDEKFNFKLSDDNVITLNKMKAPLSDQQLFDTLTAEEKVKPKVLDATVSLGAYICTRDKFQLLHCVDSSMVQWPAEQAPSLEVKNDKAGAILKSLVKPPTVISDIVREVDVFEQPFDKPTPYWCHVHNLYVYPSSFNFASSKVKAKSVCARVFLMRSDDGIEKSAIPAIFARSSDKNFIAQAITTVWWESTSAPLWDEIKIKLPHRLSESHHLLFVFYNINVKVLTKKKDGASETAETPIGYSWMALRDQGLFVKDAEHTIPVIAPPQSGIIREYLGTRDPEYIDSDKATFTFKTRLVSTVITQDENLGHYFSMYDQLSSSDKSLSSKEKKKMFEYITKADPKVVLKFFPVLFNQLFAQLCQTKSHSLQQAIFRVIVVLSQRVFDLTMVSGKLTVSDALYAYAIQYFDMPKNAIHNPADVIASNWVVLLENAAGAKVLTDAGITPSMPLEEKVGTPEHTEVANLANFSLKDVSWFLFELIFKSLVLNMAANGTSRKQITSPSLQASITRLVQFVDLHRRGVGSGFDHINRVLARIFNRLFSLTDRGLVLDLIYNHLIKLEGDHSATVFKFRFLQIVSDYEHYVPLNLPVYTPIDSIAVAPLKFWQQHYLAGLYINELRHAFIAGEESKITRSKAISRFRDLLWKHHLDDRYQAPDHRSRIAGMYFPLLMLLVEEVKMLMEKTQKDDMERTEWCLCGLWIFRYMNRDAQLRQWWKGESTENLVNLFTFLKYCFDTFQNDEAMRDEIVFLMAETYDMFMDDLDDELQQDGSKVMEALSLSILYFIRTNKVEKLTVRLLQIVRTYVIKFRRPLFRYLHTYTICGDLTYEVFNLCQSQPRRVMMCATSVLYLMLRTNNDEMGHFARMKLQSTSAVSRLVKREGCNYDEIRNCLEAMALYKDQSRATSWDNQIREFINRHARIIRDNIRAAATAPAFGDRKAEIFYQISLEYVYSPDLRITWLGNLAQHHEALGSLVEAATCKVQIASLIAEYLTQVLAVKQPIKGVPEDPSVFSHAFPTIKDEKNFSVIWLEGNTILSPSFSEDGLVKALNEAVDLFIRAEDFESAAEIQLILAHYFKENRRWEMLAPLGTQLSANSQRLYETNRAQSRVPPNFYRVAFFGKGFEEDDGKEYIYRVNPSQRLADFTSALKERYIEKLGAENFEILGNKPIEEYDVDISKKNYLQIVNCEIYHEYEEAVAKDRLTYADRSFDVRKFCFETPYSPDGGKLSEEVSKTWKRKIILSPAKTFPYILTRVLVRKKEIKILKPIESAVDLLLTIVSRFKEALNCVPPNTKTVQIILQGSVLTQVNAGPLAIIREFLGNADKYPPEEVFKIGEQVKHFVRLCQFGFRLNAALIEKEPSLAPLHEEMSKAFKVLQAEAAKHIELK